MGSVSLGLTFLKRDLMIPPLQRAGVHHVLNPRFRSCHSQQWDLGQVNLHPPQCLHPLNQGRTLSCAGGFNETAFEKLLAPSRHPVRHPYHFMLLAWPASVNTYFPSMGSEKKVQLAATAEISLEVKLLLTPLGHTCVL